MRLTQSMLPPRPFVLVSKALPHDDLDAELSALENEDNENIVEVDDDEEPVEKARGPVKYKRRFRRGNRWVYVYTDAHSRLNGKHLPNEGHRFETGEAIHTGDTLHRVKSVTESHVTTVDEQGTEHTHTHDELRNKAQAGNKDAIEAHKKHGHERRQSALEKAKQYGTEKHVDRAQKELDRFKTLHGITDKQAKKTSVRYDPKNADAYAEHLRSMPDKEFMRAFKNAKGPAGKKQLLWEEHQRRNADPEPEAEQEPKKEAQPKATPDQKEESDPRLQTKKDKDRHAERTKQRTQIADRLKGGKAVGILELQKELGLSRSDVIDHVHEMIDDGSVEPVASSDIYNVPVFHSIFTQDAKVADQVRLKPGSTIKDPEPQHRDTAAERKHVETALTDAMSDPRGRVTIKSIADQLHAAGFDVGAGTLQEHLLDLARKGKATFSTHTHSLYEVPQNERRYMVMIPPSQILRYVTGVKKEAVEKAVRHKFLRKYRRGAKWHYVYPPKSGKKTVSRHAAEATAIAANLIPDEGHQYQKGEMYSAGRGQGHWVVEHVEGGKILTRNDESGKLRYFTPDEFRAVLKEAHTAEIQTHIESGLHKRESILESAKQFGTAKHIARAEAELKRWRDEHGIVDEKAKGKGKSKAVKYDPANPDAFAEALHAMPEKQFFALLRKAHKAKKPGPKEEMVKQISDDKDLLSIVGATIDSGIEDTVGNIVALYNRVQSIAEDESRPLVSREKAKHLMDQITQRSTLHLPVVPLRDEGAYTAALQSKGISPMDATLEYHRAAANHLWNQWGIVLLPSTEADSTEAVVHAVTELDRILQHVDGDTVRKKLQGRGLGLEFFDDTGRSAVLLGREYTGAFLPTENKLEVRVQRGDSPITTLVHELAHALDYDGPPLSKFNSMVSENSSKIEGISSLLNVEAIRTARPNRVNYYMDNREVLARASGQVLSLLRGRDNGHRIGYWSPDVIRENADKFHAVLSIAGLNIDIEKIRNLGMSPSQKALIWALPIIESTEKAFGHKHLRKYRDSKGKWRYIYPTKRKGKGAGRHEIGAMADIHKIIPAEGHEHHVGEAISAGAGKGHWVVDAVDGDKLTVRHDDVPGSTKTVTRAKFKQMIHDAHQSEIHEHVQDGLERRQAVLDSAQQIGSAKHIARAAMEVQRWKSEHGIKDPEPIPEPVSSARTPPTPPAPTTRKVYVDSGDRLSSSGFHRSGGKGSGAAHWWLRDSAGNFLPIPRVRGDENFRYNLHLPPGTYTLGTGKGRDAIRSEVIVTPLTEQQSARASTEASNQIMGMIMGGNANPAAQAAVQEGLVKARQQGKEQEFAAAIQQKVEQAASDEGVGVGDALAGYGILSAIGSVLEMFFDA